MKKIYLSICAGALILSAFCGCSRIVREVTTTYNSEIHTAAPTTEPIPPTTELIPSTTQLDVSSLTNEEFANRVANDLSNSDVIFSVRSIENSIAFLDAEGTDKINAHVGFSDFGNSITLSFHTDGSKDECYFTLMHLLESEILNIDESDQVDILAHYLIDKIDYSQGRMQIKETVKENIRVILIQL